jgi:hypothetical protein
MTDGLAKALALVVAIVVLAALAVVVGSPLLGGALAGIVGVAVAILVLRIGSRDTEDPEESPSGGIRKPFRWSYKWTVQAESDIDKVIEALTREGKLRLSARRDDDGVHSAELDGGSQLRTRLMGGYFVGEQHLPIHAHLQSQPTPETRRYTLELRMNDAAGIALRDQRLRSRFDERALTLASLVSAAAGSRPAEGTNAF